MRILATILFCLISVCLYGQKKIIIGQGTPNKITTNHVHRHDTTVFSTTIYDTSRITVYDTNYNTVIRDTSNEVGTGGFPNSKSFEAYGAIPDANTAEARQANQAAMDSFIADATSWDYVTLNIGVGNWYMDTTVTIPDGIECHFVGIGNQHGNHTALRFPSETRGFHIIGDWVTITNIKAVSTGVGGDLQGTAFVVQGHATKFVNCEAEGFSGSGWDFSCFGATNCNTCYLEMCRAVNNGGNGFRFGGTDANNITMINCDAVDNDYWGFNDESFLGVEGFGNHTANNDSGAYRGSNVNASTNFFASYSEAGQAPISLNKKGLILGGTHGAGFAEGTAYIIGSNGYPTANAYRTFKNVSGSEQRTMLFGDSYSGSSIINYTRTGDNPLNWYIKYQGGNVGAIEMKGIYYMTDSTSTSIRLGNRPVADKSGRYWIKDRVYIGPEFYGRYITFAEAAPTTGSHISGDIVFNSSPGQGEPSYWQCIASGSPGTWEGFNTVPGN